MEQALSRNVHNESEQRKIDSIISYFSLTISYFLFLRTIRN